MGLRPHSSGPHAVTRKDRQTSACPDSGSQACGPTLTPKGVSSVFSTGSPDVLFESAGTQGRSADLGTLGASRSIASPSPLTPGGSGQLSPLSQPRLQTRRNLPSSLSYSPTGEKETAVGGGGEKVVRCRAESAPHPVPRTHPVPGRVGLGGDAAGPCQEQAHGPFPARPQMPWGSALSSSSPRE